MKIILATLIAVLGTVSFNANAGGIDCRSGVDHKHPNCFVRPNVIHVQHHGHRHWHHGHRHHRHAPVIIHRDNWVAPLVGGVILGAVIADANARDKEREERVIVQPTPGKVCTEWKEIMTDDGKIYRERTCKDL